MARKRAPNRFDEIIDAATDVFVQEGFGRARIAQVAQYARTASGTVYLYAAGKDALFELALRRALEDPTARDLTLPVPNPTRDDLLERFGRCLHAVCHLPALWLASERDPSVTPESGELGSLLRESWSWFARYRRAVLLVRSSATEWPGLPQRLDREFTQETVRRWALYLERRQGPRITRAKAHTRARFLLTTLAASALGLGIAGEIGAAIPDAQDEEAAVRALAEGLLANQA